MALNHQDQVRGTGWLAESIRATVFPTPGAAVNAQAWWVAVMGAEPEVRTTKPATREHLDEGSLDGRRLRLSINPLGVIQWQVLPGPLTDLPEDFVHIGPLHESLPSFEAVVDRWMPMCPPATRIAFGAVALIPQAGHDEGYATLARYLRNSVQVDPRSSDFLYRINRRRPSRSVDGLVINRLSTWNVSKVITVGNILASRQTGTTEAQLVNESYACRVELDVNTAPTFDGVFDPLAARRVFQELKELGLEILEHGDVP